MLQVEEFMSTDELGDQLCWVCLLSELGMGFGHLVKLNAVSIVFPVVAIVGGKPFASNTQVLKTATLEFFFCRPNGACFFWGGSKLENRY